MGGKNRYSMLKQVSVLMALDMIGFVGELIATFASAILDGASHQEVSNALNVYATWTIWTLRLIVWLLTLAALSRLSELHLSFGKARIWYLLRIPAFLMANLTVVVFYYRYPDPLSNPHYAFALFGALIFIAVLTFLGDILALSAGSRAILFADATLLDSFGLETCATQSRRCGNALLGFAAVQTIPFAAAVALAFRLLLAADAALSAGEVLETETWKALVVLDAGLISLCLLIGVGTFVFRILALIRANQAYRAFRKLTQ